MTENGGSEHYLGYSSQERGVEILRMVGLQTSDLRGKNVLDIGASTQDLARYAQRHNLQAEITSFDISRTALMRGVESNQLAVQGNIHRGLPFKNDSFDLVICCAVPGIDPLEEGNTTVYIDMLRTLRAQGEIRVTNPYGDAFGVGTLLYQ
jgi:ubiquinone/menaquinone biosynthesis C-methylase UbiE